jgi:iron complex transport system substrate-binding protein
MFKYRSHFLFCLLVMLSIFVTACGSTSTSEKAEGKNEKKVESEEAETRMVKTIHGEIEIPANSKRIVVEAYLPTLLLLGEKPVGATKSDLGNIHIQDQIAGIESTGENSKEKILALDPDLIISANVEKSAFEDFSKIAPTVIIPYETYKNVHKEVRAFGEMLGKDEEAEKWLAAFDVKMTELREKINAVIGADETVSIFGAFGKDFYIYGDGIYRGGQAIYTQLQLTPPERIKKELINTGETYKQASLELLDEYAGDYIFFDESNGGSLDKEDSVWGSIEAVKKDQVFYLDPKQFWPYDPIAVLAQAEEVTNMLVSKKQNEKEE